MESGSKPSQGQFLLFRVIRTACPRDEFNPRDFNLQSQFSQAQEILDESESFQSFLDAIEENDESGLGFFAPIREQQLEILAKAPTGTRSEGPIGVDESPVNATLINFLKAVQEITPDRDYKWRYSKAHLTAEFPPKTQHGAKRANPDVPYFTAITDGQLQHADSYRIKIVLECKRYRRRKCALQVDMQEAAQVVAWVKQYPSNERQRVVVSQNGEEIYINFAQYDDA
ncbi:hypothetical protein PISL3812_02167 [Talaromyces islandicus]|uniref:Fungal-type protein kinase domain-containing protein n=1 Tax=Talaromyces islandicus TaxID=28573 RepID=A0A0U1LPF7_TALIS|nr:hypothetical protein PISL3812_02167 [Talaromyces islandicus]